MSLATVLTVQEQLEFLLAVERLLKDAETVRRTRDRLLDTARQSQDAAPPDRRGEDRS